MSSNFKLIKKDGNARRGELITVHGTVQTPLFMNVGTVAAIKGGVSSEDLENIGCQVELSNTKGSADSISSWTGRDRYLRTPADFRFSPLLL